MFKRRRHGRPSKNISTSPSIGDLSFGLDILELQLKLLWRLQEMRMEALQQLRDMEPYMDNRYLNDQYLMLLGQIESFEQLVSEIPESEVSKSTLEMSQVIQSLKKDLDEDMKNLNIS